MGALALPKNNPPHVSSNLNSYSSPCPFQAHYRGNVCRGFMVGTARDSEAHGRQLFRVEGGGLASSPEGED